MIQVPFTVKEDPGHQPVMAEVPGAVDHVSVGEGVTDVLAGGPVDREAGVEEQQVQPGHAQKSDDGGEEGDDQ